MTQNLNKQVKEPAREKVVKVKLRSCITCVDGKGAWICPKKFPVLCRDIEACEFDCERMRRDTDQYP